MKKYLVTSAFIAFIGVSQSWAQGEDFTQNMLAFINAQPEVQKMLKEKSKTGSCGEFGEFAGMSKEALRETVTTLDEVNDNSKEANEFREKLKFYPENFVDLIFAQADCGGRAPGHSGVSVTVGIKQDGAMVLINAVKY